MENNVLEFANIIDYNFNDISLLTKALTHSSHSNDIGQDKTQSNERLEFLGDAVLGLVVGEILYKKYPDKSEGELTKIRAKIICEKSLYELAKEIDLGEYLLLSKGEILDGGKDKPSILSDAVEAVLGAIFLDGGFAAVEKFIQNIVEDLLKNANSPDFMLDSKSKLQKILQKKGSVDIEYIVIDETGLPHDKVFTVEVYCDGEKIGTGKGKSKKEAEQSAAKAAIDRKEADVS